MPNSSRLSFRSVVGLLVCCFIVLQLVALLYLYTRLQLVPAAPAPATMHRPQFVLFGDSLTQHSFDEGEIASCFATSMFCKMHRIECNVNHDMWLHLFWYTSCRRLGRAPCQPVSEEGKAVEAQASKFNMTSMLDERCPKVFQKRELVIFCILDTAD